jgi:hypothetical protein
VLQQVFGARVGFYTLTHHNPSLLLALTDFFLNADFLSSGARRTSRCTGYNGC